MYEIERMDFMKKFLVLTAALAMSISTQVFACDCPCAKDRPVLPPVMQSHFGGQFHRPPCHKMFKPDFDKAKFEQELGLTDEQKAKIEQIKQNAKDKKAPLEEQIKAKFEQKKAIMDEKLTAKERLDKLAPIDREIGELGKQIHKIQKESKDEVKALLSDKQLKKLDKMKADAKKEFKKNMKKGKKFCKKGFRPEIKCNCAKPAPQRPDVMPPQPPVEK